jgi:hypothetical protein
MIQMIPLILLSCLMQTAPLFSQGFSLAFGSCLHHEKELALLSKASAQSPDAFVFKGDNTFQIPMNPSTY